ncbi:ribonuclease E inhibitor RraB [Thalassotalea atypica]|uniref:ribonuclease E inhibitor RraB n=1 Tax=Thalassotalea atypica TaxID=2054316 RepID=UPI002572DE8E|nr:ribonuclease E inhibitor RraB [Thalassotalea atypica]
MDRNTEIFPEDAIGNTLWQINQEHGELVLELECEVEFSVIFTEQEQALKFGQFLLENGQKISFSPYQGNETLPWEITAYPMMLLSYENLVNYQALLMTSSEGFLGVFDGWYCPSLNVGL